MKVKDKGIYKISKCPFEKYAYSDSGFSFPLLSYKRVGRGDRIGFMFVHITNNL
jgi:hypothetical protein